MKLSLISAVAGVTLLTLATCSPTTKLAMDWQAPQKPAQPFDKIVAIAMSRDNIMRRIAENEFVKSMPKQVKHSEGLASYSVIPDAERDDVEKVKARLQEAEIDGVVVFRLVDANTKIYANQGGFRASFWGYYGWAYPMVYSPGYMMTEEVIRIESTVYDVETAELVWTSMTESTDPKSSQKVIDDVVRLSIRKMKELGLIQ